MEYGLLTLGLIFIATLAGNLTQGLIGFGAAVIMLQVFTVVMPMSEAVCICQVTCIVSNLLLLLKYRKSVRWKPLIMPIAVYLVLSFLIIRGLSGVSTDFLKPWMGLLFVVVALYSLFGKEITVRMTWPAALVFSLISAVLAALFSISGPIIAIYLLAATDTKEEYLADCQVFFLICNAYGSLMRILTGQVTLSMLPCVGVGVAATALGLWIGSGLIKKIRTEGFKRLVYIGVGLSGLVTFLTSL